MILISASAAAVIAAIIQRITGLAFVLVLIGPVVVIYGPVEGVTIAVLLAVVASICAVPTVWRDVDWRRTIPLVLAGVVAAPFGALITRVLSETALLFTIAAMAIIALLAPRLGPIIGAGLRGRRGALIAGATAGFMHASSGLSGPALAAFAVGDRWNQRGFTASAQVIFLVYGLVSVLLRGLPSAPVSEVLLLSVCTAVGILGGALLTRVIPIRVARIAMLTAAWAGSLVVLLRAILTVLV
ncbi:MAG TPA: hypothetical protein DIW46_03865 [Microbacterium sp.]|uniref:TSUP family transporter n=1 Tax=Microbacterium sp. TaxID=51671 RepID=UPI000EC74D10|nr:hypothetical protein [Microbacterium sp.]